jgi:hypothetical protein
MRYQVPDRYCFFLLAFIISLALGFSLLGIMFGYHWDESRIMESARETFRTGNPLPGWYVYPSLPHDLASLVQLTKLFSFIYPGFEEAWKQHLMVRGVFILYSCAGIVFTFLLARLLTSENKVALIAAGLLAFSWEFGYHSRWVAPDTIMMTNVVAAVFFATKYYLVQRFRLLVYACIFGGLALASKYPAGLVFIPLFLAGVKVLPDHRMTVVGIGKQIGLIGSLTSLVFLLTTPGFIFHFEQVMADLTRHIEIYQSGHFGHTLPASPFAHLWHMLEYLALAVFSSERFLSLVGFLLVLPGIGFIKRFSGTLNAIWLSFPVIYLAFFLTQDVFIVRNYQVLLPFCCILSAMGAAFLLEKERLQTVGKMAFAGMLMIITYNAVYRGEASWSIVTYNPNNLKERVQRHIQRQGNTKYYLTDRLVENLNISPKEWPKNVSSDTSDFISKDQPLVITLDPLRRNWCHWEAYHHNLLKAVIGPLEVNMNYYPNWAGYQRALVLPYEHYRDIKKARMHAGSP